MKLRNVYDHISRTKYWPRKLRKILKLKEIVSIMGFWTFLMSPHVFFSFFMIQFFLLDFSTKLDANIFQTHWRLRTWFFSLLLLFFNLSEWIYYGKNKNPRHIQDWNWEVWNEYTPEQRKIAMWISSFFFPTRNFRVPWDTKNKWFMFDYLDTLNKNFTY